jgi:hypothetical protein
MKPLTSVAPCSRWFPIALILVPEKLTALNSRRIPRMLLTTTNGLTTQTILFGIWQLTLLSPTNGGPYERFRCRNSSVAQSCTG